MARPKHTLYPHFHQALSRDLKAISCPARLDLMDQLATQDLHVRDMVENTPLTQGSVSGHLSILLNARLVEVHEHGLYNKYRFDIERLEAIAADLNMFISYLKREDGVDLDQYSSTLEHASRADGI